MFKLVSFIVIFLIIVSFIYLEKENEKNQKNTITVEEVKKKIDNKEDMILLDVRSQEEYDGPVGHIEGSILLPLPELNERISELEKYKEKPIIAICLGGMRSGSATRILRAAEYNAINMIGGMMAYNNMIENLKVKSDSLIQAGKDTVLEKEIEPVRDRESN